MYICPAVSFGLVALGIRRLGFPGETIGHQPIVPPLESFLPLPSFDTGIDVGVGIGVSIGIASGSSSAATSNRRRPTSRNRDGSAVIVHVVTIIETSLVAAAVRFIVIVIVIVIVVVVVIVVVIALFVATTVAAASASLPATDSVVQVAPWAPFACMCSMPVALDLLLYYYLPLDEADALPNEADGGDNTSLLHRPRGCRIGLDLDSLPDWFRHAQVQQRQASRLQRWWWRGLCGRCRSTTTHTRTVKILRPAPAPSIRRGRHRYRYHTLKSGISSRDQAQPDIRYPHEQGQQA